MMVLSSKRTGSASWSSSPSICLVSCLFLAKHSKAENTLLEQRQSEQRQG